jgi:serine/threonine protein kinase
MGRIFHATDTELQRDVAVKVLADRYSDDQDVRARFRREARAAARLSGNPNIVTIFDVVDYEGRPMIVMEFLDGGSLEARVEGTMAVRPRRSSRGWHRLPTRSTLPTRRESCTAT